VKKSRNRPITTKLRQPATTPIPLRVNGWLTGRSSYLRIADGENRYLGSIDGQSLYRLAKAIVRRFEEQ
jgi:hypothetical protein